MKYTLTFLLFGLTCAYYAYSADSLVIKTAAASLSVAFLGVGLAYAFLGPQAFLKRADGRLHFLSYVIYWPYHLLNWATLTAFRYSSPENAFDLIADNIYLGCRLNHSDMAEIERLGITSVLDLTSEFSEISPLRGLNYLCVPILDTKAPELHQLESGARWILEQTANGPVYVHCALGHGRSATFVVAYLLLTGKSSNTEDAINLVKAIRSHIGLHPEQTKVLNALSQKLNTLPY